MIPVGHRTRYVQSSRVGESCVDASIARDRVRSRFHGLGNWENAWRLIKRRYSKSRFKEYSSGGIPTHVKTRIVMERLGS